MTEAVEFVKDQATKECFDPQLRFSAQVAGQAMKKGLCTMAGGGCDRGRAGDMLMLGPPFIDTRDQIDEIVGLLEEALGEVEKKAGL